MRCGYYSARCIVLTICILQIISTTERQVFDFLGYMWLPIIANFFNIIFVIFGFFGTYQYRVKYVISYLFWLFVWLAWNIFVICFYLNVGVLNNKTDILNIGTGSASWWEVYGTGCIPDYPTNHTSLDPFRPIRPVAVHGCLVSYEYVEVIHAGVQCFFSTIGACFSVYLIRIYSKEENNSKSKKKKPSSMYSVEYSYSPQQECSESPDVTLDDSSYQQHPNMTPRRVKRQSRHRSSGRSQIRYGTHTRAGSQRSRRIQYLNPVNQIMDKANESSTSTDSNCHRILPLRNSRQGHSNPMYVHSRPNSQYSLSNSPYALERPPSVHSSYSNYHGQRPSLNPQAVARNVNSTFLSNQKRHSGELKTNAHSVPKENGTIRAITTFKDTFSREREKPPPYMFGINSETVI